MLRRYSTVWITYPILLFARCVIGSNNDVDNSDDGDIKDVTKGGFFDIEIAPENFANVPYKNDHLTVWKHLKRERYYVRPIAKLLPKSSRCVNNNLTGEHEMIFQIELMNNEAIQTVYDYIKDEASENFTIDDVALIPMERIRQGFVPLKFEDFLGRYPPNFKNGSSPLHSPIMVTGDWGGGYMEKNQKRLFQKNKYK